MTPPGRPTRRSPTRRRVRPPVPTAIRVVRHRPAEERDLRPLAWLGLPLAVWCGARLLLFLGPGAGPPSTGGVLAALGLRLVAVLAAAAFTAGFTWLVAGWLARRSG